MSLGRLVLGAATVTLLAAPAIGQTHDPRAIDADPATADGPIAPRLAGLGDHHFAVTTEVPACATFWAPC